MRAPVRYGLAALNKPLSHGYLVDPGLGRHHHDGLPRLAKLRPPNYARVTRSLRLSSGCAAALAGSEIYLVRFSTLACSAGSGHVLPVGVPDHFRVLGGELVPVLAVSLLRLDR
jgi:hypothetical protein